MAKWINRTLVQAPRNGTNAHTIEFAPGTAGNLLVAVTEGPVTNTIPDGWTRQVRALNSTELSVYTKTAGPGETSFTVTHNGSNYPIAAVIYEFLTGSAWVGGVAGTAHAGTSASPTLAGMTGTNLVMAAIGVAASDATPISTTWDAPTVSDVNIAVLPATTDGYGFSVGYIEDYNGTTWAPTSTTNTPVGMERVTFAINVATTPPPPNNAVNVTVTATLEPKRWASALTPRTTTGTLQPQRWAGTL